MTLEEFIQELMSNPQMWESVREWAREWLAQSQGESYGADHGYTLTAVNDARDLLAEG